MKAMEMALSILTRNPPETMLGHRLEPQTIRATKDRRGMEWAVEEHVEAFAEECLGAEWVCGTRTPPRWLVDPIIPPFPAQGPIQNPMTATPVISGEEVVDSGDEVVSTGAGVTITEDTIVTTRTAIW